MGDRGPDADSDGLVLVKAMTVLQDLAGQGYPLGRTMTAMRIVAMHSYDMLERHPRSQLAARYLKLAWLETARHLQHAQVRWGGDESNHQPIGG